MRGGEVRSQTMKNVNGENVGKVLNANVEASAALMTYTLGEPPTDMAASFPLLTSAEFEAYP